MICEPLTQGKARIEGFYAECRSFPDDPDAAGRDRDRARPALTADRISASAAPIASRETSTPERMRASSRARACRSSSGTTVEQERPALSRLTTSECLSAYAAT